MGEDSIRYDDMVSGVSEDSPYWATHFGVSPFLPMSREKMDDLGWDNCDLILVTGDAYVDHPSFGMALIGRRLDALGFRAGIITQRIREAFSEYYQA